MTAKLKRSREPGVHWLTSAWVSYLDQAGGDEGFCFGNERFKQALVAHADLPLTEQPNAFADTLAHYQRGQLQRDDITMVSFRPI
jgi:sigma-B regulation protein RsbU (phosphoserine phosphatase)